jgi:hypothetical protein
MLKNIILIHFQTKKNFKTLSYPLACRRLILSGLDEVWPNTKQDQKQPEGLPSPHFSMNYHKMLTSSMEISNYKLGLM